MKIGYIVLILLFTSCVYENNANSEADSNKDKVSLEMDIEQAERLAALPLKCLDKEYPNKMGQVLGSAEDLKSPKTLHPAFFGCFDWHSSVHGHWMLTRLAKEFPAMKEKEIMKKLSLRLTKENIEQELKYFDGKYNKSFERTYGWAWLLKLHGELLSSKDSSFFQLADNLGPLAELIVEKYSDFLPKLTNPIRTGEHPNTAFALSFAYDYALITKDEKFKNLITERAKFFYMDDQDANISYEPSGFDFLSPILEEIHIMSKVLPLNEFQVWLSHFLPGIYNSNFELKAAKVSDRTDGKLVHLDGLNFSRAWCLFNIARNDQDLIHLKKIADMHIQKSLPSIIDGDYMGEHWLASFALYALLERSKK